MSWFCSQQRKKTGVLNLVQQEVKFDDTAILFVAVPRGFQTVKRQHWRVWLATTISSTCQLFEESTPMLENRPETTLCGGNHCPVFLGQTSH